MLITAAEIRVIVTPNVSFDVAYFSDSTINYVQDSLLKPLLTADLYDAVIATPNSFTTLVAKIKPFLAYAVAYEAYLKDLERQTTNAGFMDNHTQWSKTTLDSNSILGKTKEREYFYGKELGDFLIANADDYPDFDPEKITYEPNFRRFFPI